MGVGVPNTSGSSGPSCWGFLLNSICGGTMGDPTHTDPPPPPGPKKEEKPGTRAYGCAEGKPAIGIRYIAKAIFQN